MREVMLCAVDATPTSGPVLRFAVQLAERCQAGLIVLHVVESPNSLQPWYKPRSRTEREAYRRLLDDQMEALKLRLHEQIRELTSARMRIRTKLVVESGAVVATVLRTAQEHDASLVVIGKGRQTAAIALIAERIARQCRRPLVFVPAKGVGATVTKLRARPRTKALRRERVAV